MGITAVPVKSLNIIGHILLVATVLIERWKHYRWF